MTADHSACALCGGRGYVSDGSIEDGMMSGRADCPGPFVRPAPDLEADRDRLADCLLRGFADLDQGMDDCFEIYASAIADEIIAQWALGPVETQP